MRRARIIVYIVLLAAVWFVRSGHVPAGRAGAPAGAGISASADPQGLAEAMRTHASDVQVEGSGTVVKVLPDDTTGDRHQKFLMRVASGGTLLVAHNIDIAPRVDGIKAGDEIFFKGYYVWNEKGGVVHWTHHDPGGRHATGYLKLDGKVFQ